MSNDYSIIHFVIYHTRNNNAFIFLPIYGKDGCSSVHFESYKTGLLLCACVIKPVYVLYIVNIAVKKLSCNSEGRGFETG